MDLRAYYRKIREAEGTFADEFPLVVSLETPDGGKPGVVMEVTRAIAAKLLVDGKARIATEEDRTVYAAQQQARKVEAEKAELARRVQVAIISDSDLQAAKKK